LELSRSLDLQGPSAPQLKLDGLDGSRLFHVHAGAAVRIQALKLTRGAAPSNQDGGAILNEGDLELRLVVLEGNSTNGIAGADGGAVASTGSLTIDHCAFTDNHAPHGGGGAVFTSGSGVTSIDTTSFTGNTAQSG